jgi:hypothetical protein
MYSSMMTFGYSTYIWVGASDRSTLIRQIPLFTFPTAGTHPDVGAVAKRHHAADDETPFRGRFPENRIDPRGRALWHGLAHPGKG